MLTKNRVAKLTAVRQVQICLEDVPTPLPEEMLIKIEAAGICGSDLHYFRHGGLGSFKQKLPMALGHEPAGTVVDPNGHAGFSVGDRVAIEPSRPCLSSPWSLRGRHNLCKEGSFMGAMGQPGCFSDFVCATPFQCCKLPPSISFEAAALLEPIAVALHAVNLAEIKFSDEVAIYGAGAIGLCIFLVLRRAGVQNICMVDRLPFRQAFAVDYGATAAFPFEDAVDQLKKQTGGRGCSLVFDTAGDDASLDASLRCAAVGARIALIAIPEADHLKYNPHQARTKEIRLLNPHRSTLLLREAVELFEDADAATQLERLVSHRMPLKDVQIAFEMAAGYSQGTFKIMLQPGLPRPRAVGRIGLLGVPNHTSAEYIDNLRLEGCVEVCYAAAWRSSQPLDASLQEICRQRGIPYLGAINVERDVERLAAFKCDLVLSWTAHEEVASVPVDCLRRIAGEGVVNTHLGLLGVDQGTNPVTWSILEARPQGVTTYFVTPSHDLTDTIIDTFTLEMQPRSKSSTICNSLSCEAVRRAPTWLASLRSGVFDMSAMRTIRLSRQYCLARRQEQSPSASRQVPNDSYISWDWRCAFLERFSDALDVVRSRCSDGSDLWFSIDSASCVQLDALPQTGVVISTSADALHFVVRASDGLVTCRMGDSAAAPQIGVVLQNVVVNEPHFCIPVDFAGIAIMEEVPPPPPPLAAGTAPRRERPPREQATGSPMLSSPPASMPGGYPAQSQSTQNIKVPAVRRSVPIYDLKFEDAFVNEFKEKAAEVLTSGRPLSEGKFCRAFEAAFAEQVHAPFALVTTSGTMALNIALRAVGVRGKAVITPSNTFFATQVAVENAGGQVLFADCEPEFMQLCPEKLRTLLGAQIPGSVAAVILVHVAGIVAPFAREIRDIAHAHGAALVEDAAHAHTSHLDGVGWAGTIGDIAAFSFFPTKVMTTGEGGMITTSSEAFHKACREIIMFGADLTGGSSRFTCARPDGTNGRVPELTAVLGLLDCGRVQQRVLRRQQLVAEYVRGLAGCEAYRVLEQPGGSCSYYKCVVKLTGIDREFLRDFAKARGVSFTGEVYHLGVHRMPAFAEDHPEPLPVTDAACAEHACPPLYPELSIEDIRYVCEVMLEAARAVAA